MIEKRMDGSKTRKGFFERNGDGRAPAIYKAGRQAGMRDGRWLQLLLFRSLLLTQQ